MRGDSETGTNPWRCSKAVGQTVLSGPSIRSLLVSDKGRPPVMNQRSLTEAGQRDGRPLGHCGGLYRVMVIGGCCSDGETL